VGLCERLVEAARSTELPESALGDALYNLACVYATTGRADEARALLPEAIARNPRLESWSRRDPDLAGIAA